MSFDGIIVTSHLTQGGYKNGQNKREKKRISDQHQDQTYSDHGSSVHNTFAGSDDNKLY